MQPRMVGSPSHLLIVYVATGGKNVEDLGSDEEQIVFFVYLLYDINNSKVVQIQSHYVKPQPNDLTETILTDECKEETGLDENRVRNGQSLDIVLEELDRFLRLKGVHPDVGGNSFVILTDGPCHLRQCLHHEISTRTTGALPSYFFKYYDVRKEFKKRYENVAADGIKDILDYLKLEEDQSVEFGVRQCQDMAQIVNRLLSDSHTFGEPEIINERLEGGICTRNEVVDDNTVVRARGLPWQSSDQDIARFFKGLNIAKGGVALCLSPQGRRNGEALVRFENEEQRDLALKRHKHHIGQRYIEVYKASGKDFINVAGGSNAEAQQFLSRGGQIIIRMRGLPFTATPTQVLEFFAREPVPCQVLDGEEGVLFVHYPDGRSTGDAFVLFATEEESQKALKKHKELMGQRYIELFKSTTAEVQQVLNRSMDPRNPDPQETHAFISISPTAMQVMPGNFITHGQHRDCIRVTQLPHTAQVTDILHFLGEHSARIAFQGVHMVFTASGEPSGEAFIQMQDTISADVACRSKNGQLMSHRGRRYPIVLMQVSGDEMSLILANYSVPLPATAITPGLVQQSYVDFSQVPMSMPIVSMPSMSVASMPSMHVSAPSMPQFPLAVQPAQRPIQIPNGVPAGFPQGPMPAHTLQLTPSGMTPVTMGTMQVTQLPTQSIQTAFPPSMASMASMTSIPQQRPTFYPSMLYWYPSPPVSPHPGTYFTHPGPCSIVMRGLPYNVTVADVVNYFQGFPEVVSEVVQLQTNTEGKPNGDAIVTFATRAEAERAIVERNRRHVGGRLIELFMA